MFALRSQSWQSYPPGSEIEPGYIVKNHDLINSNFLNSIVIGPIFPNSFVMVNTDQYMNYH